MSDIIDAWTIERDGVTYGVALHHDGDSSPSDWTTEREEPDLFRTWRDGDWQFVGVVVTPTYEADRALYELDALSADVWSVQYGNVAGETVDRDRINDNYVSDLILECLTRVQGAAPALRALLKAAGAAYEKSQLTSD